MTDETKELKGIDAARAVRKQIQTTKEEAQKPDDEKDAVSAVKVSPRKNVAKKETPNQELKPKDNKEENAQELSVAKVDEVQPAVIENGQLILTPKHKELIAKQIAPTATKEELELFFMMAYRTRLDPLLKQLYFIKYGTGEKAKVSYVTSIDGFRIIAHRTKQFAGIDEPKFIYASSSKNPTSCTVTVYKKGSERGFTATVHFAEYSTGQNLWAKMPHTMLAKVAEAHALRKAFPQDLSGIYTTDEMEQAEKAQTPQKPTAAQLPPAPTEPMINKDQVEEVKTLMAEKGITKEQVLQFVAQAFNKKMLKEVTEKEAWSMITEMRKRPDLQPIDEEFEETPQEDERITGARQIFGPLSQKEADEISDAI
jgi:phage recombination protein Bet